MANKTSRRGRNQRRARGRGRGRTQRRARARSQRGGWAQFNPTGSPITN
jgi:hypothetical protein